MEEFTLKTDMFRLPPLNVIKQSQYTVTDPNTLTPGTKGKFDQIQFEHCRAKHLKQVRARRQTMKNEIKNLRFGMAKVIKI